MPSWKGDPTNPAPNPIEKGAPPLSEKKIVADENRAAQTRRDQDDFKNVKIDLKQIDTTIFEHIEKMQLTVVDDGNNIKVPIYYASPEKWKSVRNDGVFRDYNGNIVLPAIVFKREMSEKDATMMTFNRYLRYPVMRKFSPKNMYTPFSTLVGQNVPVNDVYDVVYPDHMVFTYRFIIWTEYVEQMNKLVERINFETEDYWGGPRGMRFRTRVDSFNHTIELQVDRDRIVKTEFNLMVNGYLLPDQFMLNTTNRPSTRRVLTPKKILMGMEVVATDYDFNAVANNDEKWRSQKYPNLQFVQEPPAPPVVWSDTTTAGAASVSSQQDVLSAFNALYRATIAEGTTPVPGMSLHNTPATPSAYGEEGWMAKDDSFFYVYSGGQWRRVPINAY